MKITASTARPRRDRKRNTATAKRLLKMMAHNLEQRRTAARKKAEAAKNR